MGPGVGYLPTDICGRWCLVVTKVVAAVARTSDDMSGVEFAGAEAVAA
jgi:hypothetical protein